MDNSKLPLGSAYVPPQRFVNVMDAGKGRIYGTIFADLVYTFGGSSAACQSLNSPEAGPAMGYGRRERY